MTLNLNRANMKMKFTLISQILQHNDLNKNSVK